MTGDWWGSGGADATRRPALVLLVALGLGLLWALLPFAVGLLGGVVLYVLCAPLQKRLAARMPPRLAALLVVIGVFVLVLTPGVWVITVAIGQTPSVVRNVLGSGALGRLSALHVGGVAVGAHLAQAADALLSWASLQTLQVFAHLTRAALNLVIALFELYYLLLPSTHTWDRLAPLIPFGDANTQLLRDRFFSVTQAMVIGILVTALLQGSIVGIAFWGVGLPNALFWGVVTGFASILPVLGSALVWVPGTLFLLLQGRYGPAIALALIGAVVASNIDNVVRPIVYRRVSNLHPMTTLVGAFAGVEAFGLIGVLLGPLAISYFFELLQIFQREHGEGVAHQRPG